MTSTNESPHMPARQGEYQLDLTGAERSKIRALAERLTQTPPGLIDDPDWLRHALRLSCGLPLRLVEAIRAFRNDPGQEGMLLLTNLPIDEDALPETPGEPESVERAAALPAAISMLVGLHLGEVIAYRDEKSGALVQNVVPVRGLESSQSNAGSVPLEFHVENAFHAQRPDYVGLLCLKSDHAGEAGTLVSSIRQALALLEEADREVLREARFITAPPPSFRSGDRSVAHPVLDGSLNDPNIRVDFNATTPLDDEARQVLDRLRIVLEKVTLSPVLQPGQMVFVDNRIVVHGRTHFTPRYDGTDRWLHRVYVHLDNRRSRAYRTENGPVLA